MAAAAGGDVLTAPDRRDSCESAGTTAAVCEGDGTAPPALTGAVEEMLRRHLLRWAHRLVELQPKVRASGLGGMQPRG